jgi:hypothetical protein
MNKPSYIKTIMAKKDKNTKISFPKTGVCFPKTGVCFPTPSLLFLDSREFGAFREAREHKIPYIVYFMSYIFTATIINIYVWKFFPSLRSLNCDSSEYGAFLREGEGSFREGEGSFREGTGKLTSLLLPITQQNI